MEPKWGIYISDGERVGDGTLKELYYTISRKCMPHLGSGKHPLTGSYLVTMIFWVSLFQVFNDHSFDVSADYTALY